jgi:type I restriction enzyme M protein
MNERKTENIIRGLLRLNGYESDSNIIIEEQSSDNPRIDKLLKTASKNGKGKGYPEFIISFANNPDKLVVIECKAETTRHESPNRKEYDKYAVDGVLLYASYLKDSFDVVAIAASGETEGELKLSHFLWLKNKYACKDISDKDLLSPISLFDLIEKHSKPLRETELVEKAIEYNDRFHDLSIPEYERCTFISSILIGLQDRAFCNSYKEYHNTTDSNTEYNPNEELIESLLKACESVLKRNEIDIQKRTIILDEYSKIKNNNTIKSPTRTESKIKKTNTVLRDLIQDIHENILPYITNDVFDVLGQFYTHFIKYAGNDSKTGLVLTPSHITDLFCDLGELSAEDVVYDPCCGTGGFLVASMNRMLKLSGNSLERHKEIKKKQLIGVEVRADMFTHACSNMMMRGDGKSQIYRNDCFDEALKEEVKIKKPTKTFLNPPYDKGEEVQLRFIENALDCIQPNGICVAICSMSTAISSKKEALKVRERLLNKHTLQAVLSMPDDLFHPRAGVVTAIMVFKAHKPHPKNKETFFGYFKDDKYEKLRAKGRIDRKGQWSRTKEEWLRLYTNNKSEKGVSVMQYVTYKDEWCAEAYMKTDYQTLTKHDFLCTLKNFISFNFMNPQFNSNINSNVHIEDVKNIDTTTWKRFRYDDLFVITRGKPLYKKDFELGDIPYISASSNNNGVSAYVSQANESKNAITIAYDGSIGESFYQPIPFFASEKIAVVRLKGGVPLNPYIAIFLISVIKLEKFRFNYGLKWAVDKRMKKHPIYLPTDKSGKPDWEYMENYIKSYPYSQSLESYNYL